MKFRSLFDDKQSEVSNAYGLYTDPETAQYAQQSDKDSCDINKIIERFNRTGLLPDLKQREAFYADIRELQTADAYQRSLDAVINANSAFNALPANIRAMFGNDPAAFVDAMDKKQFTKEMADAGLIEIVKPVIDPTNSGAAPTIVDTLIQEVKKA